MGTDLESPSSMRLPRQIRSEQNLETPLDVVQACRNVRSPLINGSLASKSHREQQLHLKRTQELRTEPTFTTISSNSHVDSRLYVCPTCDGNVEHPSFQTRSVASTTTTVAATLSLIDGSCNRTILPPDSHSSHGSSMGTNSYTNKNNTRNISSIGGNNSRGCAVLCHGSDTLSAMRRGVAIGSMCPWGHVLSLFCLMLVVVNEHGGVLLAQARSTSTAPSTTTSRNNIRGFSPQPVDYPPELRPRVPQGPLHQYRIFLQRGQSSEAELPVCSAYAVCNKISTYNTPYAERMCRCPGDKVCSTSLDVQDGHTIVDKDEQFKVCEPVKKLPQCKLFSEVSYTMIFYPDNEKQLVAHCVCPKNAVTYVVHKDPYRTSKGYGYFYSFACSPLELECKRKEPCRLFSARKRTHFEEVTTTILCRCPSNRSCPAHHTDHGVVPGKVYSEDPVRTYSGYCV